MEYKTDAQLDAEIDAMDISKETMAKYDSETLSAYAYRLSITEGAKKNEQMLARYWMVMRETFRRQPVQEDANTHTVYAAIKAFRPHVLGSFPENVILEALETLIVLDADMRINNNDLKVICLIRELEARMEDEGHPIYEMTEMYCDTGDLLEDAANCLDIFRGIREKQEIIRETNRIKEYDIFRDIVAEEWDHELPRYEYRGDR